jgi:hypothetical protein
MYVPVRELRTGTTHAAPGIVFGYPAWCVCNSDFDGIAQSNHDHYFYWPDQSFRDLFLFRTRRYARTNKTAPIDSFYIYIAAS